ncbi:hypothetical protein BJX70DRAFT_374384 [Aspergillus crustosus]
MQLSAENREERTGLLFGSQDQDIPEDNPRSSNPYRRRFVILLSILLLSLITNIITLSILLSTSTPSRTPSSPSKYANLHQTHTEPYVLLTDYTSANTTLSQTLWSAINIDAGVVALSSSFSTSHNLRPAQHFPWDKDKGIYILHGFHNLHCIKIIALSLFEFQGNQTQSRSWHHIIHCLDALRRQILCDADDTPRATERRVEVVSGVNQHRICRDWGELENWAKRYTACYKRPERPEDEVGLRRFMHCPEGSGYMVDEGYVPEEEVLVGLPEESIETGGGIAGV